VRAFYEQKPKSKWDQFVANEQLFNVRSTYNEDVYTTSLDRRSLRETDIATATRIATRIESERSSNIHVAEERGQIPENCDHLDEEDRYSGVLRCPSAFLRAHRTNGQSLLSSARTEYRAVVDSSGCAKSGRDETPVTRNDEAHDPSPNAMKPKHDDPELLEQPAALPSPGDLTEYSSAHRTTATDLDPELTDRASISRAQETKAVQQSDLRLQVMQTDKIVLMACSRDEDLGPVLTSSRYQQGTSEDCTRGHIPKKRGVSQPSNISCMPMPEAASIKSSACGSLTSTEARVGADGAVPKAHQEKSMPHPRVVSEFKFNAHAAEWRPRNVSIATTHMPHDPPAHLPLTQTQLGQPHAQAKAQINITQNQQHVQGPISFARACPDGRCSHAGQGVYGHCTHDDRVPVVYGHEDAIQSYSWQCVRYDQPYPCQHQARETPVTGCGEHSRSCMGSVQYHERAEGATVQVRAVRIGTRDSPDDGLAVDSRDCNHLVVGGREMGNRVGSLLAQRGRHHKFCHP